MKIYWKWEKINELGKYRKIIDVKPCCDQCSTKLGEIGIGNALPNSNEIYLIIVNKDKTKQNRIARYCEWCGSKIKFYEDKLISIEDLKLRESINSFAEFIKYSVRNKLSCTNKVSSRTTIDYINNDIDIALKHLIIRLGLEL